jgi:selenide,water dikinase
MMAKAREGSHCGTGLIGLTLEPGCSSKLAPGGLKEALEGLLLDSSPADGSSSGIGIGDDAGYVPFGGGLLLQSVDFSTPLVDDPYRFGQIAAANALSDVYAMGGEPVTALNLVGFPNSLDLGVLRDILAGGMSKIEESGARLCGGHSVQDNEPKYGLSVTGFVEEDRVVRNVGARVGDTLVLTKPLGTGILAEALLRNLVGERDLEEELEAASRLNRGARDAMREIGVSAATDVTGYGFLGHLSEMLTSRRIGALVRAKDVPVWGAVGGLLAGGSRPCGLRRNLRYFAPQILAEGVSQEALLPLYDPQTNGGLLVAVAQDRASALVRALEGRDELAAVVGEVTSEGFIRVIE